jgi:hypothetical protein
MVQHCYNSNSLKFLRRVKGRKDEKCMQYVGRYHFEDLDVDGRMKLKLIVNTVIVWMWLRLKWVRIGYSGGPCEYGNKPSGFIKGGEFPAQLSYYERPKNNYPLNGISLVG